MQQDLSNWLIVAVCYLLGSIPTGKLVGRIHGMDIQTLGSHNTGATNISRFLGLRWAALVAIVDIAKVLVPVALVYHFGFLDIWVCAVAFAGALGHVYSIFLKFKGGKAVSSYIAALLVIVPVWTVAWLAVWVVCLKLVRIMSLVNLILLVAFVPVSFLTRGAVYGWWSVAMWFLIAFAHRSNITRLLRGQELGLQKPDINT